MRVIAGSARSLPLMVPEGRDVRPTIDRYKETVFNVVAAYIPGGLTLDIFSGSGSIGIEALSRGAKEAFFIENSRHAIGCIEKNLEFTKLFDKATLLKYDYSNALTGLSDKKVQFDFIYLDPPFDLDLESLTINLIGELDLLRVDGIMVCESSNKTDMSFIEDSEVFEVTKSKAYNTCQFTYLKRR